MVDIRQSTGFHRMQIAQEKESDFDMRQYYVQASNWYEYIHCIVNMHSQIITVINSTRIAHVACRNRDRQFIAGADVDDLYMY